MNISTLMSLVFGLSPLIHGQISPCVSQPQRCGAVKNCSIEFSYKAELNEICQTSTGKRFQKVGHTDKHISILDLSTDVIWGDRGGMGHNYGNDSICEHDLSIAAQAGADMNDRTYRLPTEEDFKTAISNGILELLPNGKDTGTVYWTSSKSEGGTTSLSYALWKEYEPEVVESNIFVTNDSWRCIGVKN